MNFTLSINCDNAAFEEDNQGGEVARILREVASQLDAGYTNMPRLMDYNGNTVGSASFQEGE